MTTTNTPKSLRPTLAIVHKMTTAMKKPTTSFEVEAGIRPAPSVEALTALQPVNEAILLALELVLRYRFYEEEEKAG